MSIAIDGFLSWVCRFFTMMKKNLTKNPLFARKRGASISVGVQPFQASPVGSATSMVPTSTFRGNMV